ncbi:MAG: hypothetical protein M1832_000168 [Thelocarpon impressellum]|nr:MAG: hypothetical protein M1832_000168 [Thelocarpon impressellum]
MASSATLPIIDIAAFLPGSDATLDEKARCADALSTACRETGFFYLTGHGIPTERTDEIVQLARAFFLTASDEEKASIARQGAGVGRGDGARGYQRVGENVTQGKRDWHEAVDLYRDIDAGEPPYALCRGVNLWPRTPEGLRESYQAYIRQLAVLGEAVVGAMGFALDPADADVFADHTREGFWGMRLIGYPPPPAASTLPDGDEVGFSCGEHSDYGCLTFLSTDASRGALQVKHRAAGWIVADPIPGAFVVNIGDMMEHWTNGLWKSTRHRVMHAGDDWRISVPFFFEPDFEARIEPLETCVKRTGGTAIFAPLRYGDHLLQKVGGNFYGGG